MYVGPYCSVGKPLWFWSCRFTVVVLCCLSVMNMYAQQLAVSNPVTCIANGTLTLLRNISSACDVSSTNNTVSEQYCFVLLVIYWYLASTLKVVYIFVSDFYNKSNSLNTFFCVQYHHFMVFLQCFDTFGLMARTISGVLKKS